MLVLLSRSRYEKPEQISAPYLQWTSPNPLDRWQESHHEICPGPRDPEWDLVSKASLVKVQSSPKSKATTSQYISSPSALHYVTLKPFQGYMAVLVRNAWKANAKRLRGLSWFISWSRMLKVFFLRRGGRVLQPPHCSTGLHIAVHGSTAIALVLELRVAREA